MLITGFHIASHAACGCPKKDEKKAEEPRQEQPAPGAEAPDEEAPPPSEDEQEPFYEIEGPGSGGGYIKVNSEEDSVSLSSEARAQRERKE